MQAYKKESVWLKIWKTYRDKKGNEGKSWLQGCYRVDIKILGHDRACTRLAQVWFPVAYTAFL